MIQDFSNLYTPACFTRDKLVTYICLITAIVLCVCISCTSYTHAHESYKYISKIISNNNIN